MSKISLIADKESFNSFIRFFEKEKNKVEKLALEKIEIDYVLDNSLARAINLKEENSTLLDSIVITKDFKELILNSEADIIIELNANEKSKEYIYQSLKNSKSIITANRKLIVENFKEIKNLEKKYKGRLYFSAAFSPLPLKTLIDNFYALDEIKKIDAILNSTTNYILTEMEKNTISLKETIEQAKKASYIEENPEIDLTGLDSLYKIILLANLFFDTAVDPELIKFKGIKGITSYDLIYAEELGYKIKLISSLRKEKEKLYIGVRPILINKDDYLASVNENSMAAKIKSNYNFKTYFKADNTDLALFNLLSLDLIQAVKEDPKKVNSAVDKIDVLDLYHDKKMSFYLRLQLEKNEEIIENIKNIFSEKNLAELILHDDLTETPLMPIVIITKKIKEKKLEIILQEVEELSGVLTVNNVIAVKAE